MQNDFPSKQTVSPIFPLLPSLISKQTLLIEEVQQGEKNKLRQSQLQRIQYLKTHKTGSSTLQGILFRYALFNNLPVFISDHRIPFPLSQANLPDPLPPYSMVIQHTKTPPDFDHLRLRQEYGTLVKDGRFVTILRHPVFRAISEIIFYHPELFGNVTIVIPDQDVDRKILQRLPQLQNLSPLRELCLHDIQHDPSMLERMVDHMDILILEEFDESLVLRHFAWGWRLEDLLYLPINSCGGPRWDGKFVPCLANVSAQLRVELESHSGAELTLYQSALRMHRLAIESINPVVWSKTMRSFIRMKQNLERSCLRHESQLTKLSKLSNDEIRKLKDSPSPSMKTIVRDTHIFCPLFRIRDWETEQIARRWLSPSS